PPRAATAPNRSSRAVARCRAPKAPIEMPATARNGRLAWRVGGGPPPPPPDGASSSESEQEHGRSRAAAPRKAAARRWAFDMAAAPVNCRAAAGAGVSAVGRLAVLRRATGLRQEPRPAVLVHAETGRAAPLGVGQDQRGLALLVDRRVQPRTLAGIEQHEVRAADLIDAQPGARVLLEVAQ